MVRAGKLVVIDEPISGLDPVNCRICVKSIIRELHGKTGVNLIMSSHQKETIEGILRSDIYHP